MTLRRHIELCSKIAHHGLEGPIVSLNPDSARSGEQLESLPISFLLSLDEQFFEEIVSCLRFDN